MCRNTRCADCTCSPSECQISETPAGLSYLPPRNLLLLVRGPYDGQLLCAVAYILNNQVQADNPGLCQDIFGPTKKGEGRRSYIGFLRFEEWCISEKCLALEDAWESCNSLNSILHDFFRGLCLPECYYVELSGYCGCFDEAWDVAELLYDVLAGVVLTCQYGDAEGHLALELLGRLHTVEAGVSVGRTNVADLADFFDCLVDVVWSVRFQAQD